MSARCLRPEIFRFLDLPRHGLQVIPYDINSAPNPEGEGIIYYSDHDRTRESLRRHSIRDAEAYDEYAMEISRYCRFIKRTLLMTPPDPTQINPFVQNRINPWGHREDLEGLLQDRPRVRPAGRAEHVRHDPLLVDVGGRFPRPVFRDAALEGPRRRVLDHRHRARTVFARHGLRAAASLHGRGRRADRRLGLCARRHGLGQQGDRLGGRRGRRRDPRERRGREDHRQGRQGDRRRAEIWRGDLRQGDRQQRRSQAHLPEAGRQGRSRRHRSRHPSLCQELQDPRLVREAEHRARRSAGVRRSAEGVLLWHDRYRRRLRLHRARFRRFQIRLLVQAAVPRLRDPDHRRSDHEPAGQALHVGVRAVRAVSAGGRAVDSGDEGAVREGRARHHRAARARLQEAGAARAVPHAVGHRERSRHDRGQHLPRRADPRPAAVQPAVPRHGAISRAVR